MTLVNQPYTFMVGEILNMNLSSQMWFQCLRNVQLQQYLLKNSVHWLTHTVCTLLTRYTARTLQTALLIAVPRPLNVWQQTFRLLSRLPHISQMMWPPCSRSTKMLC